MNRRSLLALFAGTAAAKSNRDIWQSPGGRNAIAVRKELEDLGVYDDLPENWTATEAWVRAGVTAFKPGISRVDKRAGKQPYPIGYWWRVVPVVTFKVVEVKATDVIGWPT